jgi:hypothetical protein
MVDRIDISPLVNAVERLREGLDRHRREPAADQLRDGLIQRFEFTYELSHRMLRRYLRQMPRLRTRSRRCRSRTSSVRAMRRVCCVAIGRPGAVIAICGARTNQTYTAVVAEQVAAGIPDFLAEAMYLRDQLQQRLR